MGLYDFTVYDLMCRSACCFKDRTAWFEAEDGRTLTFGQFRCRLEQLAGGLQRDGVRKGDRIGILGKNSLEYFLLYGAAAACGAIVLPVNWRLSPEEVIFNLNDGAPMILFVDPEYEETMRCRQQASFLKKMLRLKPGGKRFDAFVESWRMRATSCRRCFIRRRPGDYPYGGCGRKTAGRIAEPPEPGDGQHAPELLFNLTPADVT
jgi:long-chain acyl-CoA synthetase